MPGFEEKLKQLVLYDNSKEEKCDVKFRFYAFTTNEHSPKLINNRYFNSSGYFGADSERYDPGIMNKAKKNQI